MRSIGLIVKLGCVYAALLGSSWASDNPCSQQGEHSSISYFLIDRTDTFENTAGFEQTVEVVKQSIEPGERLIVGVSTGSMGSTRVLLDTILPAKSLWTSNMKYRSLKKHFFDCIDQVKQKLIANTEEHPQSALLETIKFVGDVLKHDRNVQSRRLFLYSDMVQNSKDLSFFPLKTFKASAMLARTERAELIWNLKDVSVAAAGLGRAGTDGAALELEKFWKAYFEKSGAKLDFIGPMLVR